MLLLHLERDKRSPLTRDEVLKIRDGAPCIMLRESHVAQLAEKRGYPDLDPEFVWEQWQEARLQLNPDAG
jgi:hypothetical protein